MFLGQSGVRDQVIQKFNGRAHVGEGCVTLPEIKRPVDLGNGTIGVKR